MNLFIVLQVLCILYVCSRSYNISGGPYRPVNFQIGHYINSNRSLKATTIPTRTPITTTTPLRQTTTTPPTATTGTSPLWSHILRDTGERLKKVCQTKGIQVHFKGTNTFRTLLVTPRIRIKNYTKMESSTTSSAPTSTALMNT